MSTPPGTLTTPTPTPTPASTPSWASVAPSIARWRMALLPDVHGTWNVVSAFGTVRGGARPEATQVPFADLPAAIRAVAARCEADEKGEGAR